MIKVGKYTAALLLVTIGTVLLLDLTQGTEYLTKLVRFWPVILIGVGIEYLIFGSIYRDPSKKVGLAFGSLLLSFFLCLGVIGYTQASNFSFFSDFNLGSIGFSESNSISFDQGVTKAPISARIDKVYLKNSNGQVQFISGDVSDIEIHTTLYVPKSKRSDADEIAKASKIRVNDTGSTLEIIAEGKEYKVFGFNQKPRMNMVVTVPRDRALDYDVQLVNGKIEAKGIAVEQFFNADTTNGAIHLSHLDGDITADTTNGSVTISQIHGHVNADSTNGAITLTDIDGDAKGDTTNGKITIERVTGKTNADTTNGGIIIKDVDAGVSADTTNGAITVHSQMVGGNWKLDTTNGSIQLYLSEHASFKVKGGTLKHRSVDTDFPLNVSNGKVSGSVNDGKYTIEIDTNSGIGIHKK